MEKVLISRQTLATRWDFESTKVIEKYEKAGIITRVPKLPVPRYSIEEIMQIEYIGLSVNPLSPLERRRLEKEIEEKDKKIAMLESKLNKVQMALA